MGEARKPAGSGVATTAVPEEVTTLNRVCRDAAARLAAAGIEHGAQEAVWLLEEALGVSRLTLRLEGGRVVEPGERDRVERRVARRVAGEPLQYILGTQEFCGFDFLVNPSVLIPRPETEGLVRETLRLLSGLGAAGTPDLADIGTGSGCIAIALARLLPSARVWATDLSSPALVVARRNAVRLGAADRIIFHEGDLLTPLRESGLEGTLDAVVSNPPYIAEREMAALPREVRNYEPRLALAGGPDGLAVHRRLLAEAWEFLKPGGWLLMEMGQGQAGPIRVLAATDGRYGACDIVRDVAGIERVICLQKQ